MKKAFTFLAFGILTALNVNAQTHKTVKKTTAATTTTHTTVAAKPTPPPPPPPVVITKKVDEYSVLGQNFLDPGIGVGSYYKGLPFGVSFEHGFTDDISGGVFLNYSSYTYSEVASKLNIFYGGVRASYHFAKLLNVTNPKLDPYAGVSLGYYHVSFDENDFASPYSSSVLIGVHAGARYMFSDNIGGFAELGYGVAVLQLGVTFKF